MLLYAEIRTESPVSKPTVSKVRLLTGLLKAIFKSASQLEPFREPIEPPEPLKKELLRL